MWTSFNLWLPDSHLVHSFVIDIDVFNFKLMWSSNIHQLEKKMPYCFCMSHYFTGINLHVTFTIFLWITFSSFLYHNPINSWNSGPVFTFLLVLMPETSVSSSIVHYKAVFLWFLELGEPGLMQVCAIAGMSLNSELPALWRKPAADLSSIDSGI